MGDVGVLRDVRRVHGHLVEGGDDAGVGQRHPLGLLGDRPLVEEAGGEQIGEHAGGYEHADDKTNDDGRALALLHVAGLSGLDVAVIVPGTLDERRSGGFRGGGLLGLGGRAGGKTLVGDGIGRRGAARIELSHNSS